MKKFLIILLMLCISMQFTTSAATAPAGKDVRIKLVVDTAIHSEPTLYVFNTTYYNSPYPNHDRKVIRPVLKDGNTYQYVLPPEQKVAYFSVSYKQKFRDQTLVGYHFFEPGDDITINCKKGKREREILLSFSGRGHEKYTCANQFAAAIRSEATKIESDTTSVDDRDHYRKHLRYINACNALIKKYSPSMTAFAAQLLRADITGKLGSTIVDHVRTMYSRNESDDKNIGDQQVTADYLNRYKLLDVTGIADSILSFSVWYPFYRYQTLRVESYITRGMPKAVEVLPAIKDVDQVDLRDKMLVMYALHGWMGIADNFDREIRDIQSAVRNKDMKNKVAEFLRHSAGSPAYNFSLRDMHNKIVKLSDYKNKVVFVDFYFTGCTNCKIYYEHTLKEIEEKYKNNDKVVFISISIDTDTGKWKNGIKKGVYNSPNGINLYTNGRGSAHELIRYYNIKGYPSPMLISKKGNIIDFTGSYLREGANLIKEIEKELALL